jgi:uncharacterized repeat protein (TIGR01451 family)/LPXTG-motif cell wall-anchored protein
MNKLFSLLRNAPKRTAALIAIIAAVIIVPAVSFAWGPDRPTYTIEHPADHVTFNSITNNPSHGDERNFVQVRDANSGNETYVDQIGLTAGHEYVVYVYYHNNAASNLNASGVGIAHGAYVKAQIPAVVTNGSAGTKAVGYVGASNASPSEVWDDVSFSNTTGGDIALRYVPGSTTIHNFGTTNGATMSDSIVTTGTALGYNSLDGVLPGCNEYAGYVTFRVKADQPNFTVTKQVRKTGTTSWSENVAVNPGDSVDYLITYKNTGTTTQNDVVISDDLPNGTSYVSGTTYLANTTNPNGIRVSDNVTTNSGINIGNYSAGAAAYVKFSAKVAYNNDLPTCGTNTLTNTASAQTNNGSKSDTAIVYTVKQCDNSNPNFTITKQVRKTGTTSWNENIAVNPGDSVDYLITYRNTGNTTLYNVTISDTLPGNVSYIAGTTYVNDAKTNDSIVNGGINIGTYTAGSTAYVRFSALVATNDALPTCGNNTLTNTASAQTSNGSKSDTAVVTVVKQCTTPPVTTPTTPSELPKTGSGLDVTAILGLGATVTSAGYYIASRRLLKR